MYIVLTDKQINRFWSHINIINDEDSCWMWEGCLLPKGYGKVGISGKTYLTHRISYLITNGPFDDDLDVCHTCDIKYPTNSFEYRSCCRPTHLWLGTRKDNLQDMSKKGRYSTPSAKLSIEQVKEIRIRSINGEVGRKLASEYGVSTATISIILSRKTWKNTH